MTQMKKISRRLLHFQSFFLVIVVSHEVLSQSVHDQEQTVLLKLKQHWGNLPSMSQWTPSNYSSTAHCSWPGITCKSNSVAELSLSNVNITGPVPPFICDLKNLQSIDLGYNYIAGEFPRALFNCSKLQDLDLSENYFVGRLPNDIHNMVRLRSLDLVGNNFTGDIPPSIGKLQELRVLSLGANLFNGSLPPEIGNLSNLEVLKLAHNGHLVPSSLPSSYTQLRKLKTLSVSRSNLIGEIPQSIIDLEALEWLDLSENDLHGKIPDGLFTLKNLSQVMLHLNKLSGEIPEMVEAPNLTLIDLSENNLTERIPEDFEKLTNLKYLVLFSNKLPGTIPEGIGRLPALREFRLGENSLSGNVPSSLWTSSTLTYLSLYSNSITGVLPEKLASNLELLDISNNKFSGKIPNGVSSRTNLRWFRAGNNLLTGTIPHELFTYPGFIELFLNENQLTGDLPSDIASVNLYSLNLSRNQLTGRVPEKLGLLLGLAYLDLSENKFSGKVPSQLGHSALVILNLSFNDLTGTIPHELEIPAYYNSFLNNPGLCASNKVLKLKPCSPKSQDLKTLPTQHLALIISASIAVLSLASSFILFVIIKGRQRKCEVDLEWKLTTFQRLNFTESNILSGLVDHNLIGRGGSGTVHRIPINDQGDVVAVKRICNNKKAECRLEQEFLSEVKILSSIQHANIVKLLCCISSESSKLLVYEYLENKSLDRWLHHKSWQTTVSVPHSAQEIVLDWPKRLQIAVGAARGLCYMHHDCLPPIIHRDIKSSNLLLDSDFNPKIADFGLAKLFVKQGQLETMSAVAGTFGYIAPEYARTKRANEKIDVYSFGVVLLELVTGRGARYGDEHTALAEWAWRHLQEDKPIEDALDEEIKESSNVKEMSSVFKLGIICTGTQPSTRPSMKQVLTVLLRCSNTSCDDNVFANDF